MNYLTKKLGMCIIYSVGYTPCASIAQSVEHFTRNEGVEGSSPFSSLTEKARKFGKNKRKSILRKGALFDVWLTFG